MANEKILVVDDDRGIARALGLFFRHEGISCDCAACGTQGLEMARSGDYDLILLDLDLPDIDGFTVLERLRGTGDTTPVIIVSGHDEEYNKLVGLGSGADDYVTKPFSMPLLLSKVRALIRRSAIYSGRAAPESTIGANTAVRGPFQLDRGSYRLTKRGRPIELTARELALFTHLFDHPNQVFTKTQLYQAVWDNPVTDENAVMVYVKRLRDKIEDDPSKPSFIQTRRGIGYVFVS